MASINHLVNIAASTAANKEAKAAAEAAIAAANAAKAARAKAAPFMYQFNAEKAERTGKMFVEKAPSIFPRKGKEEKQPAAANRNVNKLAHNFSKVRVKGNPANVARNQGNMEEVVGETKVVYPGDRNYQVENLGKKMEAMYVEEGGKRRTKRKHSTKKRRNNKKRKTHHRRR